MSTTLDCGCVTGVSWGLAFGQPVETRYTFYCATHQRPATPLPPKRACRACGREHYCDAPPGGRP